jgi:nucleoid-associated protein YgaU
LTPAGANRSSAAEPKVASIGVTASETHRVQPGDSFSSIAKSYYGSEQHARFLIASNPTIKDPRGLQIGAVIQIPPLPTTLPTTASAGSAGAPRGTESTVSGRTHLVRAGESFYAIARDVLHDASRWNELFDLNKDLVGGDARKLKVGQVLRLPAK